jgi:hypothetical protein
MAGKHPDVAAHWPPRIIVGKMVGDPKELMKVEDENIEVRLLELECEYMYSNPTGKFNLSMPDAMIRTANFTVHSYEQHKLHEQREEYEAAKAPEEEGQTEEAKETVQEQLPPLELDVRRWAEHKMVGPVVLQVEVRNKSGGKVNAKVNVEIDGTPSAENPVNVQFPVTPCNVTLFSGDTRALRFLVKIDPSKEAWAPMKLTFESESVSASGGYNSYGYNVNTGTTTQSYTSYGVGTGTSTANAGSGGSTYVPTGGASKGVSSVTVACRSCNKPQDLGQDWCGDCGESLKEGTDEVDYSYFN